MASSPSAAVHCARTFRSSSSAPRCVPAFASFISVGLQRRPQRGAALGGHAPGDRGEPRGRALRRVARELLPRQLRGPPQVPRVLDRLHRQDEPKGKTLDVMSRRWMWP